MKFASIIICHYGQSDPVNGRDRNEIFKKSLQSLKENADYPAEIICVDNGGNPDISDWLIEQNRKGIITTYIRNHDNMSFGFSWNQGFRLATGDYIVFSCNDILYKKGWLSDCIKNLEDHPDRKLIATPYLTPDKNGPRWIKEWLDGKMLNSLAGSNCMIMRREVVLDVGEFPHHRVGGSTWHRVLHTKGYLVIVSKENLVEHLEFRKGVNWRAKIKVEKTLLNGEKVDYSYVPYKKSLYHGTQKSAGVELR